MAYYSLGSELSDVFPQLHAITGCDTTLRKFRVGKFCIDKTAFIKKILKQGHQWSTRSRFTC